MNRRKQPIKYFRIYALVAGDRLAYIGKTTARELSAVYRHHIKGRCNHTCNTIGQAGHGTQLHLLTEIDCCLSVAYRHVVAWVHIFLSAGYQVVNQPGIIEDAEDLHPETIRLVDHLLTAPLEAILRRTHLPHPADADLPKATCGPAPENSAIAQVKDKSIQLSVRLLPGEKLAFDHYASHMHMTQRDALMYLLYKGGRPIFGSAEWWVDMHMIKDQKRMQKIINKLEEELSMAQIKLEQALSANPETAAPKMTARYRNIQDLVRQYIDRINPTVDSGLPLPRGSYKRFVQSLPPGVRYDYPSTEGTYVFTPIAILYGEARPPVHFWIGRAKDGSHCKLRVYEKWDYVGVSPLHEEYAVQGMKWLVSVRKAADGAMDLIAALPLGNEKECTGDLKKEKVPLAQQIANIEKRMQ